MKAKAKAKAGEADVRRRHWVPRYLGTKVPMQGC